MQKTTSYSRFKEVKHSTEKAAKKQKKDMIQHLQNESSTSNSEDVPACPASLPDDSPSFPTVRVQDTTTSVVLLNQCVQVKIRAPYRSIGTSTAKIITADMGCNTSVEMQDVACSTSPEKDVVTSESGSGNEDDQNTDVYEELEDDSDYEDDEDPGSDYEPEEDDEAEKSEIKDCMIKAVKKNTLMCLGISQKMSFLLEFLSSKSKCSATDVIITLKKIRQNNSFGDLGMMFGMSRRSVARIFHKTLYSLASVLQNMIIWPDALKIKLNLPIAFRYRYAKTQCIVDCFEVEIEKPINAEHQDLTWSEYKKAYTLKYFVSCTPDGLVTFVSEGFGGRTPDATVVEESGFVDHLVPNLDVMADRGFKNIAPLLQAKNCKIVRAPIVATDQPMSDAEVKSSRQIAALRIYVERLIRRFQEFSMCKPHACITRNLVPIYDNVMIIVGGLINLQSNTINP